MSDRTVAMQSEPLTNETCGTIMLGGEFEVRRLGYGAMRLAGPMAGGPPPDRPAATAVLHRVLELGVNLIDTADAYGPHFNEEFIAEVLHPYADGLVIATKGGLERTADGNFDPNGRPEHLRAACEGSLARLKVDTLDLYQLHRPDPTIPYEESIGTLAELRDEGKIRLIGISNVDVEQLRAAQSVAPIASVQNRYNLSERSSEDVLRACEADNVAFLPYYPIKGWSDNAKGRRALSEVGAAHDATAAAASLAWLLARSPVMLPIPGTSSLAHLEENVSAAFVELTEPELERLDAFNPAISSKLDQLKGPLSPGGRAKIREAAGPLRQFFRRLRFWDA